MSAIQHTIYIFERLYEEVPPLVPHEIKEDMAKALEQLRNNLNLTLDELEDTMIIFGKKTWPYREAFQEMLHVYEGKLGETFFSQKLPPVMKKKYLEFRTSGGTFRDLHVGNNLSFFTSEEKQKLCEALIETKYDIKNYTVQTVLSTEEDRYRRRIDEFCQIQEDMENRLAVLSNMADEEQEHPELAREIREHIRHFEYGMCLLAPKVEYEAVCNAGLYFEGRKSYKKRHSGIVKIPA